MRLQEILLVKDESTEENAVSFTISINGEIRESYFTENVDEHYVLVKGDKKGAYPWKRHLHPFGVEHDLDNVDVKLYDRAKKGCLRLIQPYLLRMMKTRYDTERIFIDKTGMEDSNDKSNQIG